MAFARIPTVHDRTMDHFVPERFLSLQRDGSYRRAADDAIPAPRPSDIDTFLASDHVSSPRAYQPRAVLFAQDDPGATVLYIHRGIVKLSVASPSGKEAIIGICGAGNIIGTECLSDGQPRMATATALSATVVRTIRVERVRQLMHDTPAFADRLMRDVLSRTARIQESLIDLLLYSSEQRLARALLTLAGFGEAAGAYQVLPRVSQELLGEMIRTTRSRVNFFMTRFKKQGYVEYCHGLRVNMPRLRSFLEANIRHPRPLRHAGPVRPLRATRG